MGKLVVKQITINYYAKQNKHNHLKKKTAEREEKNTILLVNVWISQK